VRWPWVLRQNSWRWVATRRNSSGTMTLPWPAWRASSSPIFRTKSAMSCALLSRRESEEGEGRDERRSPWGKYKLQEAQMPHVRWGQSAGCLEQWWPHKNSSIDREIAGSNTASVNRRSPGKVIKAI
jgi:hypothetical protein